jgi:hypothetical protein
MSHHPLAVALLILHIEWMTQRHYVESVRDRQDLDAQFKSLLKHHWIEEAQHAKLDTLMVESIAESCSRDDVERAFGDYVKMGGFLDEGLKQQVQFDMDCFVRATKRPLTDDEQAEFIEIQHQANRWTFLGSGMTDENFLTTVEGVSPGARQKFERMASVFC